MTASLSMFCGAPDSKALVVAPLVKESALNPELQLQEHQQRVADRVSGEDPRLLVYHGLGSGKSLSAIAAAEMARSKDDSQYGIAVPASLRQNFQKEIDKFTQGSNPEIMSFTGLALGKNFKQQPDTLIMDEAARLRNPQAASTAAAIRAARKAKRVLLLTGTPITNEPSDIASLLSMLNDQTITPQQFDQQFVGEKKVRPGLFGWLRGAQAGVKPVIKNEDKLRELLRGKVDYQPSKTPEGVNVNEQIVKVPLSPAQQKIQKAIRTKIPPGFLWKLDKEFPLSRDELAKLNSFMTGLRQVSLSTQPFRADKDMYRSFEQSSKLQKAMTDLQETLGSDPRKKAIIYSNFIDAGLKPYAAALEKNKVPHAFFHGGVPLKQRQEALKAYNEGKLRALLLGPAAAEGISTKGTSLIQLLDPHWNEARTQQARGRGLRFDSHRDLPEELKNVAVRRYLSASDAPGLIGKYILGKKRERTGDEVLERLTAEKEQFNDVFRELLREIGKEKQGAATAKKKPVPEFKPDFTPEQLEEMGVYDALYRGVGPRLASLGEWKPEWVNPVDPKGWAQWYKRYSGGRRLGEEDERQIKRWANFKSRHGGPFVKKPTPRRGWALQNWAIDPGLLVTEDQSDKIKKMLSVYAARQMAKHVARTTAK
jgi:superfamily II DNA or RNA helicase